MNDKRIQLDVAGQPIVPSCILANKNGRRLGVLCIDEESLTVKVSLEDTYILLAEMSCDVHKYINTLKNPLWDYIKNFKMLYVPIHVPHIKARGLWFEITVTIDEYDDTIKHLTGTLAQHAELNQSMNFEMEIRTEDDIDRDDYEDTTFYNPDNPKASIVDRILHDKARHYSIYHVDKSLWDVKRTFDFDGTEVIECLKEVAEEVDCIIILGESDDESGRLQRTISFYDAKDYCPECKKRGDFTNGCTNPDCTHSQKIVPRYGHDTGIFINRENLGENINLSADTDNIKNCYRLTAGDDDMTAAVINCNPSGSRYIWRFTDDMKEDMSDELREKINTYEEEYNNYRYFEEMTKVTESDVNQYNSYVNKYDEYSKEKLNPLDFPISGYTNLTAAYYYTTYLKDFLENMMMPYSPDVVDTTAEEQLALYKETTIGVRSLSNISNESSATEVKDSVGLYVDTSRYSIEITTNSYNTSTHIWTGIIKLESLTDETDTAQKTTSITFSQATGDYIKNQVEKFIKKKEALLSGIVNLLKSDNATFTAEMKKYNLVSLSNTSQVIEAVLKILDDAHITEETQPDVYEEIYKPLSQKKTIVNAELAVRETEVKNLENIIEHIDAQQKEINSALNLEAYLGEELWLELLAFRREDEQENTNFISDGLNDAELMQNAQDFFDRADEDIAKRAESQYTISCTLKDLLIILPDVYDKMTDLFDVGNWLRIEIDDKIYKLRLTSYEINFGSLKNIQVEFSDAKRSNNFFSAYKGIQKTTRTNTKTLSDLSKRTDINDSTTAFINNVTEAVPTGQNGAFMYIKSDSVMINDDESLQDYLSKLTTDINGALSITLTNEFQGIVTDEFGQGGDYSDCRTEVNVFYNGSDITSDPSIHWNVVIPQSVTGSWNAATHTMSVTNIENDYAIVEIFADYKELNVKKNFVIKKIRQPSSPIVVNIDSSAGNIFNSRGMNTILTCTVMKGTKDITDQVKNFHWIKYDKDGNEDPDWSRMSAQKITLSTADIQSKGIFKCEVSF